jgi:hypothetical protein
MICFRYDVWAIAKAYVEEPMQDNLFRWKVITGYDTAAREVSYQKALTHFEWMTELLIKKIKGQTPFFTGRLSAGIKRLADYPLFRSSGWTERSWLVYDSFYGYNGEVRTYWTFYFEMYDYIYFTNVIHTKNVPYGKPVEVGSKAHVAPAQNLRRWSLGHPGPGWNEWSLQHEIASDGTPPKSMFYNGMIQFELSMRHADIGDAALPTEFWEPYQIRYASTRDGTVDSEGNGFDGI